MVSGTYVQSEVHQSPGSLQPLHSINPLFCFFLVFSFDNIIRDIIDSSHCFQIRY